MHFLREVINQEKKMNRNFHSMGFGGIKVVPFIFIIKMWGVLVREGGQAMDGNFFHLIFSEIDGFRNQ